MKAEQPRLPGLPEEKTPQWVKAAQAAREAAEARAGVTVKDAAAELAIRVAARRSLLEFTTFTLPSYGPEPAQALMASALDRVVEGTICRLMIIAPPQHGESELASVRLPAFWLGRRPDDPVIISSYGFELARAKSRQARAVVEGGEFQMLFPGVAVDRASRDVSHWQGTPPYRGSVLAVGVGGPITGHGAMLGLSTTRSRTGRRPIGPSGGSGPGNGIQYFSDPHLAGGAIALICTRWHIDDLVGRILAESRRRAGLDASPARPTMDGSAVAGRGGAAGGPGSGSAACGLPAGLPDPLGRAPGEPLCPLRFGAALAPDAPRGGGAGVAGRVSGDAAAAGGNRIERAWLKLVVAAPSGLRRVRYWDRAATEAEGCATAGVSMGMDDVGEVWVLDVVRGQWAPGCVTRRFGRRREGTGRRWRRGWSRSRGRREWTASSRRRGCWRGSGCATSVTGGKDVRLEPFAAQAEAGRVRLVKGPWMAAFVDEMALVPNGRFRDQVDAAAGAYNRLSRAKPTGPGFMVKGAGPAEGYGSGGVLQTVARGGVPLSSTSRTTTRNPALWRGRGNGEMLAPPRPEGGTG